MRIIVYVAAAIAVLAVVLWNTAFYTVRENQQALILQFGAAVHTVEKPGLGVLMPFVQSVLTFEKRILDVDVPAQEINMRGSQGRSTLTGGTDAAPAAAGQASNTIRIVVDAFGRYRITDPLKFYQALQTTQRAESQLQTSIQSTLREVLAGRPLSSLLSVQRIELMRQIRDQVNAEVREKYGIDVVDVRIRRAEVPPQNRASVFGAMRTQAEAQAAQIRAVGAQKSQEIRAQADAQATITIAEGTRDAAIIRGEGDAQRNEIFARAFGHDPQFFEFYRTMQAYQAALSGSDTTMVLTPDSEFLRLFNRGPDAASSANGPIDPVSIGLPAAPVSTTPAPAPAAVPVPVPEVTPPAPAETPAEAPVETPAEPAPEPAPAPAAPEPAPAAPATETPASGG